MREPLVGVCRTPILDVCAIEMRTVRVGTTLADVRPEATGPLRCVRNGESVYPVTTRQHRHFVSLHRAGRKDQARAYLGRATRRARNWERIALQPGDIVHWHEIPQDKEAGRTALSIAAVVAAFVPGGQAYAAWFAAANVAYNIFVPPSVRTPRSIAAGGDVHNTSLNGNQAKLDEPIWRCCGVNKYTPPLAAPMYYRYLDSGKKDELGNRVDDDQYVSAVFAVGTGRNKMIRAFMGKTPLDHLNDIIEANYLEPGQQPVRALCNVQTSAEVTGFSLESDGRYVGPYVVCSPKRRVTAIELDFGAPVGLGTTSLADETAGDPLPMTVTYRTEIRDLDDYGRPVSAWRVAGPDGSRTASTNTPQRWTERFVLPAAARVEVRVVRTDLKDINPNARAELQWIGLKGFLSDAAPLNPHTAHFELVMRASEQLSVNAQSDFSLLMQGYARTWSASGGWSCELGDYANYTPTRNPAWYLADLWADPVWGEGLPDDRIDLPTMARLAAVWDARQDHFDYVFDSAMSAWDAAQLIAHAGRAQCFRRFGINTLERDELATLPKTAVSPRTTVPNSMKSTEKLPGLDVADGIVVQFTNNLTWDNDEIECPCPGFTVTNEADPSYDPELPKMSRPIYQRWDGVKGATHVKREGLFAAASTLLRTRTAEWTTTVDGMVLSHLAPVDWRPEIGGFTQSGDVALWDGGNVISLSEPADFHGANTSWLTLMRDDGSLTTAVEVTRGATEYDVVLPAAPDFAPVFDAAVRERTRFFLGHLDQLVRVTSVTDGGTTQGEDGQPGVQLYDIAGFVDDERVHMVDRHLLPGPGDVQDPIDPGGDDGAGGVETLVLVRLLSHGFADGSPLFGGGVKAGFVLRADGTMAGMERANNDPDYREIAGEWMLYPVEAAAAARFEVMVSAPSWALDGLSGSAVNTWLTLDTDREWYVGDGSAVLFDNTRIPLIVTIREIATGVVQDSKNFVLTVFASGYGSGGGIGL